MINQRKHKHSLLAWTLLILIILPVVVSACDQFIGAQGTVYEWLDDPEGATGEVYVDIDPPADRELAPIADVHVAFPQVFMSATTDSRGFFSDSIQCPVRRAMMDIRVEKEGYKTLEAEFEYAGYSNFNILLVREEP